MSSKPTPAAKPGRPCDENRRASRADDILDCAATVFATHGYQNTEMQFIADAVQVGKGTIYRYFPSKEELFLKSVSRGMDRLRQEVDCSMVGTDDGLLKIERAIHAYLAFFRKFPHYAELLIQERAQFRDAKQQTYFAHRENHRGQWRDMYADLIAAGRIRDVPVPRIMDVVSDLVYGTMFTNYFTGQHKPLEEQAKDLVDILFFGVLSDSERDAYCGRKTSEIAAATRTCAIAAGSAPISTTATECSRVSIQQYRGG